MCARQMRGSSLNLAGLYKSLANGHFSLNSFIKNVAPILRIQTSLIGSTGELIAIITTIVNKIKISKVREPLVLNLCLE